VSATGTRTALRRFHAKCASRHLGVADCEIPDAEYSTIYPTGWKPFGSPPSSGRANGRVADPSHRRRQLGLDQSQQCVID
jgi:hypothetical protein